MYTTAIADMILCNLSIAMDLVYASIICICIMEA